MFDDAIDADNVGKRASEMMVKIIKESAGLHNAEQIKAAKETHKPKKTASVSIKSSNDNELNESDEISVRKFLIDHEREKELIPLCQIAFLSNPTHNHIRPMYNEFLILPGKVRNSIINYCADEEAVNIGVLHTDEALDLFCKEKEQRLSVR